MKLFYIDIKSFAMTHPYLGAVTKLRCHNCSHNDSVFSVKSAPTRSHSQYLVAEAEAPSLKTFYYGASLRQL